MNTIKPPSSSMDYFLLFSLPLAEALLELAAFFCVVFPFPLEDEAFASSFFIFTMASFEMSSSSSSLSLTSLSAASSSSSCFKTSAPLSAAVDFDFLAAGC